jgi:outer membrane protein
LIAARHAVTAAEANVKAAEAQLRPQIGLQGSYSNGWDQKAPNDNIQDIRLLGQVTMPVYEGGAIYSEVRAAKETLGQRQLEADSARDQVRSGVLAAWSQFESAKARVTSAEAQIAAAEVALNGIREEAKVGQRTTLDVLISAQDLLSAQVNLVTARRDWVVASYQVLSAVGRLSAARLGLKVANYNPESHYNAVRTKLIGTDTPQ